MGGRVEKLKMCEGVKEEVEKEMKRLWERGGGLPWVIPAKVRSKMKGRGDSNKIKIKDMALSRRKSSGSQKVKKKELIHSLVRNESPSGPVLIEDGGVIEGTSWMTNWGRYKMRLDSIYTLESTALQYASNGLPKWCFSIDYTLSMLRSNSLLEKFDRKKME